MGRVIESGSGVYQNFQLVAGNGVPNAVWIHVAAVTEVHFNSLVFEALPGSGPFRLEYHVGRIEPVSPATPDVLTLALATYGDYGSWEATSGYDGTGYWADGAEMPNEDNEDDMEYASILIYPVRGSRTVGAGIRVYVEGTAE